MGSMLDIRGGIQDQIYSVLIWTYALEYKSNLYRGHQPFS